MEQADGATMGAAAVEVVRPPASSRCVHRHYGVEPTVEPLYPLQVQLDQLTARYDPGPQHPDHLDGGGERVDRHDDLPAHRGKAEIRAGTRGGTGACS